MSVTTLADPMFKQFWKESEEHDDVRCLHEDGATLHSVVRHDRPTAELNEATPNGCLPQENEMKQEPEEQFFEKAKTVAKQIDNGTYSKELSDEEIEQVWKQAMDDWTKVDDGTAKLSNQPFVFFAKSILRKAQEK